MIEGIPEPEAIEASHLVRCWCVRCGAPAIADPSQLAAALCGNCLWEPSAKPLIRAEGEFLSFFRENRRWEAPRPENRSQAFPEPEVSSRSWRGKPIHSEVPSSVAKLAGWIQGQGWFAEVRYSRGSMPHGATGKPLAVADYWGVRFARPTGEGPIAGWAINKNGDTWDNCALFGAGRTFKIYSVTELKEQIKGCLA